MRDLSNIHDKLNIMNDYFKSHSEVQTVYLFGSFGTQRQTELSDVDFAVLFSTETSLMKEMEINSELSSILCIQNVDMINLNKSPVSYQHEVISTGDIIFEKNRLITQDFVENVLEIYHDYGIVLHKFMCDLEEGLKEELLNA
jgi:uncharacterized protein